MVDVRNVIDLSDLLGDPVPVSPRSPPSPPGFITDTPYLGISSIPASSGVVVHNAASAAPRRDGTGTWRRVPLTGRWSTLPNRSHRSRPRIRGEAKRCGGWDMVMRLRCDAEQWCIKADLRIFYSLGWRRATGGCALSGFIVLAGDFKGTHRIVHSSNRITNSKSLDQHVPGPSSAPSTPSKPLCRLSQTLQRELRRVR
jgi:hypothetical protein